MTLGADSADEHLWRMRAVSFETDGAHTEYGCDLCPDVLVVLPGGVHPVTV